MINDILTILWVFLPVGLANTGPVTANNITFLKKFSQPLDFGKTFRGKRIFGDHKTIRGIIAGVITGLFVASLQMLIFDAFSWPEDFSAGIDYTSLVVLLMGICMGFGAVAGDAIKSFFKRQVGVAPGKNWVPFDQLDFVVGGLILSLPFVILSLNMYILALMIALIIHPAFNILAWLLRLQDKPF